MFVGVLLNTNCQFDCQMCKYSVKSFACLGFVSCYLIWRQVNNRVTGSEHVYFVWNLQIYYAVL